MVAISLTASTVAGGVDREVLARLVLLGGAERRSPRRAEFCRARARARTWRPALLMDAARALPHELPGVWLDACASPQVAPVVEGRRRPASGNAKYCLVRGLRTCSDGRRPTRRSHSVTMSVRGVTRASWPPARRGTRRGRVRSACSATVSARAHELSERWSRFDGQVRSPRSSFRSNHSSSPGTKWPARQSGGRAARVGRGGRRRPRARSRRPRVPAAPARRSRLLGPACRNAAQSSPPSSAPVPLALLGCGAAGHSRPWAEVAGPREAARADATPRSRARAPSVVSRRSHEACAPPGGVSWHTRCARSPPPAAPRGA